jgi:hypothetical protein
MPKRNYNSQPTMIYCFRQYLAGTCESCHITGRADGKRLLCLMTLGAAMSVATRSQVVTFPQVSAT